MTSRILTSTATSISEFKANPMKVMASTDGEPLVVLNRNVPAFYCLSADVYESIMDLVDDLSLLKVSKQREKEESIKVNLDDL